MISIVWAIFFAKLTVWNSSYIFQCRKVSMCLMKCVAGEVGGEF